MKDKEIRRLGKAKKISKRPDQDFRQIDRHTEGQKIRTLIE